MIFTFRDRRRMPPTKAASFQGWLHYVGRVSLSRNHRLGTAPQDKACGAFSRRNGYNRDMSNPHSLGTQFGVGLAAGMPAPLVCFVAASAAETPGTVSVPELAVPCVFGFAYAAFALFWTAPRRHEGDESIYPTLLGSLVPLAAAAGLIAIVQDLVTAAQIGSWLVSALAGGWLGAKAMRHATKPREITPPAGHPLVVARKLLTGDLAMFVAVAVLLSIALVLARTASPESSQGSRINVIVFGALGGLNVFAAILLGVALYRAARDRVHPRVLLGLAAFSALLLTGVLVGAGLLFAQNPLLRISEALLLAGALLNACAVASLTVASVMEDRMAGAGTPSLGAPASP